MNILKKEFIELIKIIHIEKGIVIYIIVMTLFIFSLTLLLGKLTYSIAYLVCGLGSLVNLVQIHRHKDETKIVLLKILYIFNFTAVSLGFLFMMPK